MALQGSLGDVNVEAISTTIADTAVDIFIYDTRKDSDGGAWRKRTQHTSWYNETLNTSTRGSRREFPAVAVIVAESNKVTIYDGDDPDMPMWMVFNPATTSGRRTFLGYSTSPSVSSVFALNGQVFIGSQATLNVVRFLHDNDLRTGSTASWITTQNVSQRNDQYASAQAEVNLRIVDSNTNDAAMIVLPNAPIDSATGLPIPTIAVATDGGVSVIKDNGTVVDIATDGTVTRSDTIDFINTSGDMVVGHGTIAAGNRHSYTYPLPISDTNSANHHRTDLGDSTTNADLRYSNGGSAVQKVVGMGKNNFALKTSLSTDGLTLVSENVLSVTRGMVAYITSSYNTGWMHGDIKLATLSDTDDTDVTGSELNTDPNFDSGVGIFIAASGTVTHSSGTITSTKNSGGSSAMTSSAVLTVGKAYYIEFEITAVSPGYTHIDSPIGEITSGQVGTHSGTFIAGSTTVDFGQNNGGSTSSVTFTRISIRLAEEDRSFNNNGLQVFGTVTKNPVATGADLVAYSNFTSSNYIRSSVSYNFGSPATITFMGWQKTSDISNYQYYISVNDIGTSRVLGMSINSTAAAAPGTVYFYDNTNSSLDTTRRIDDGQWHFVVGVLAGTSKSIYIDGELQVSSNVTALNLSNVTLFNVGVYSGSDGNSRVYAHRGNIALVRVSATAPSPEQIKKIYEDEKFLFQENAQATLYGSSDAVTALAYDDDTKLLHVGTSAGRSVFQGLRRIDNTTDAVGSAISASNGMVAED